MAVRHSLLPTNASQFRKMKRNENYKLIVYVSLSPWPFATPSPPLSLWSKVMWSPKNVVSLMVILLYGLLQKKEIKKEK